MKISELQAVCKEEAQSAGDTIKKELDGFVNNMNKFLM